MVGGMNKKVVLITTGQPSTNPRIVKEADALYAAGYDVTVLYCFFINWATEKDSLILQNASWKYLMAGGSPQYKKGIYLFTRIRHKIAGILNRYVGNAVLLAERTQARAYDELLNAAKQTKADWYIGHNLGALPVAVNAARFNNAKAGFDFEDYHRGEILPEEKNILKRIIYLENKYVSQLNYYSTASPLVTEAIKKNYPDFTGRIITLLNCFPLAQQPSFKEKELGDNILKLFWFSQTIGTNRGLDLLISALGILKDSAIHLTLAGRCDDDMLQYIKTNAGSIINNIHFVGIIQPEELPAFASQFDVGMAIELTVPENRDICLTNKIFTYLLAGNAIILSATKMQYAFNKLYNVGESFSAMDMNALTDIIIGFKDNARLNAQRRYNYDLATNVMNWEKEKEIFLMNLKSQ